MELKKIKNVQPNRQLFKKIAALLLSVTVIIGSYIFITNASEEAVNTIEVIRLKDSEGIPAGVMITDDHIETYDIIRREFDESMIKASEVDMIIGKYAAYFLRGKSILYEDQLMEERIKKNEWLYELEEDTEVLTVPYNYLEGGGDILMPGDRVRIRVAYEVESIASDNNPNNMSRSSGTVIESKVEVLFDSIVVKDMLNSNSHSIYEVYKEVMKLSDDKKRAVMKSDDFLKNIQPKALLLEGTREQVENYARYKLQEGSVLVITILNRQNGDVILDQLPTLEKEVESWIDEEGTN